MLAECRQRFNNGDTDEQILKDMKKQFKKIDRVFKDPNSDYWLKREKMISFFYNAQSITNIYCLEKFAALMNELNWVVIIRIIAIRIKIRVHISVLIYNFLNMRRHLIFHSTQKDITTVHSLFLVMRTHMTSIILIFIYFQLPVHSVL